MIRYLLSIFVLLAACNSFAQKEIDSLKKALVTAKHDSARGQIFNSLGMNYYLFAPDSAYKYWKRSYELAASKLKTAKGKEREAFLFIKADAVGSMAYLDHGDGKVEKALKGYDESAEIYAQLNDSAGSATVYNNMANIYLTDGKIDEALALYDKALNYFKVAKNYGGVAMAYQNKALISKNNGNMNAAIELYNRSLKIRDSINDSLGLGHSYYELGIIHNLQKDYQECKLLLQKSLLIRKKINDIDGIGASLAELGMVCLKLNNDSSIWFLRESVKYRTKAGNNMGLGFSYSGIGSYYADKKMWDSALVNYNKGLDCRIKSNEVRGQSLSHYLIGEAYYYKHNYNEALKHAEQAYKIGKEHHYLENINKSSLLLSSLYKEKGDFKKSLEYYEEFKISSDSLLNKETKRKAIESQLNFEFDKKVVADSIKAAESKKTLSLQIAKEKTQKYALYGGLALVLLFSVFIFNRFKVTQKQKKIIEIKEQETQKQNEIITFQKHVVEEKQKEILDSINYAKRIQKTLLANDELLNQYLPQHFVLFKPKDIVSGDFYWATHVLSGDSSNRELFYIAACDSTGHGVPGAFMSLLNISFLSEAIKEKGITSPAEVFDQVRQKLIREINKEGQKDGFDGILLCIDKHQNKITYAAANNAPVVVRNKQLIEFDADKMPVGIGERTDPFSLRSIEFKQGDLLYLYTDGYPDQFGGPKGKKFKYRQLNELLVSISEFELAKQKEVLNETFETWRGDLEQVDDVCIIGIRL